LFPPAFFKKGFLPRVGKGVKSLEGVWKGGISANQISVGFLINLGLPDEGDLEGF